MRLILVYILFLPFIQASFCQEKKEYTPLDKMFALSWSGKSGLEANNISWAVQASTGYIWLTTYVGIQQFDGYKSTNYDETAMPFLRSNGFRKAYQSPYDDYLYFASQSSGIIVNKNGVFEQLQAEKGEIPSSIQSLAFSNEDKMYIGTANQGVYVLENNQLKKIEQEIFANSNVFHIFQATDSIIYFGTEGQGLIKLKNDVFDTQYTTEDGLSSNIVNTMERRGDTLFLGTRSGIDILIDGKITSFNFCEGKTINDLFIKDDFLWAGTESGLGRYSFTLQKSEFISSLGMDDLSRVNHLMYDSEDNLWLCTGRNGLVQLRNTGIVNYNYFDGFRNDNINVVIESYDKNKYFVGADDGKVYELKQKRLNEYPINGYSSASGIRDILEQEDGTLWIASYRGVIRKRGAIETYFGLDQGFPSTDIRRILEDKKGNLWFGTRSGGLVKMQGEEIVEIFDQKTKLLTNFIFSIEENQDGDIYVGTHSGGLYVLKDNDIEHYGLTDDDSGIIIFNTHLSDNGDVWVVSTSGISLFKNGSFIELNFQENYSSLSMYDLLEDDEKNLWVTTNRGLIRIEAREIEKFINNPSYLLPTKLIDEKDGMSSEECSGAVRSLQASNGDLLIPTIGGVSVIRPEAISKTAPFPPVYIEYLDTSEGRYRGSDTNVQVNSGTNRFTFIFTALGFVAPERIKFKYKLNNFDEEFTELGGVRSIEYTKLPPGKYRLDLKSSNRLGEWNEAAVHFNFEVLPAFYETNWFYFTTVLLMLLVIYLLYRWRIYGIKKMNKKLIKVNQELDGFVYSASHDLRSPIASVLGLIDLSRLDKANVNDYLSKMKKSMLRLDDFIGEIIDFSSNERMKVNKDAIHFEELVFKVIDELYFLDLHKRVQINVSVNQREAFMSDARRMTIILRNLISNALKYRNEFNEQCFIHINIEVYKELAVIKIEDNGIGIEEKDLEKIFEMFYRASENSTGSGLGLYIVNETVQKLDGKLKIKSVFGKGTLFQIKIPARN